MERRHFIFCIALTSLLSACATQPIHLDESKEPPSPRGLGPFNSLDDVEEALCPAIMKMPSAQSGQAGIEYCGFVYHTPHGQIYNYRRILFSTRCDHYRYFPHTQEILKHDHLAKRWDKIADVELTVDRQAGEIIRGSAKLLPGKDW